MEQQAEQPQSFEAALARLEEVAVILDRNEVSLADALKLCAEAAALTRYCREQLAAAEGKLEQLIEAANGDVAIAPLTEI